MNMYSSHGSLEPIPLPKSAAAASRCSGVFSRRRSTARAGETRRWPGRARGTRRRRTGSPSRRWRRRTGRAEAPRRVAGSTVARDRRREAASGLRPRRGPRAAPGAPGRAITSAPSGVRTDASSSCTRRPGRTTSARTWSVPERHRAHELVGHPRELQPLGRGQPLERRASAAPPARRRAGRPDPTARGRARWPGSGPRDRG